MAVELLLARSALAWEPEGRERAGGVWIAGAT